MNKAMTDRTWLLNEGEQSFVVCGPEYVADVKATKEGKVSFSAEQHPGAPECKVSVFGGKGDPQEFTLAAAPLPGAAPALHSWEMVRADREASKNFDDSTWKALPAPQPMGADGDTSAWVWYRTSIDAVTAGTQYLQIPWIADHPGIFVNGKRVTLAEEPVAGGSLIVPLELNAGPNTLAIFVSHSGREKFYSYAGPLEKIDLKGMIGPVTLSPEPRPILPVNSWKFGFMGYNTTAAETLADPDYDTSKPGWFNMTLNKDAKQLWVFAGRAGFGMYRTTLPPLDGLNRKIHFEAVYNKAVVYLNGRQVGEESNSGHPFDVPLDVGWRTQQPNVL
ncbi:MAG: hypothetical protein ABUL72_03465, partial [Armatimonadota bacterium]